MTGPGFGTTRCDFIVRGAQLAAVLGIGAPLLQACGGDDDSEGASEPIDDGLEPEAGPLRVFNYADYVNPDVVASFEQKYGVKTQVTGLTAAVADLDDLLRTSLLLFGALVLGLSLLLLMTVFRSIFVPIAAVLHFLLSLGATYGVHAPVPRSISVRDIHRVVTPGDSMKSRNGGL